MKRLTLATLLASVLPFPCLAGEVPPPVFTAKPTATKAGEGKFKIEFAVSRETDVAVYVEDANPSTGSGQGARVVRHLVAGVLGQNPPAPLKPGLAQSIEWDGLADYGKPAGAGPFKVRVALGLDAKYDKAVVEDPQNIGTPKALAVGPDGTLYALVCAGAGGLPHWSGERIVALDREGNYLRTVFPFPAGLKKEEVAGFGTHELDGRPAPLLKVDLQGRSFSAGAGPRMGGMAVTGNGAVLRPIGGYGALHQYPPNCGIRLAACGVRGDAPWGREDGPDLLKLERPAFTRPFVCAAADNRHAYVSGIYDGTAKRTHAAVYRVKLPDRGPAESFFGRPEEPGKDDAHLGDDVRGLAVDGKGNLLIADHKNDRVVVVSEADGRLVGQFAVEKPDGLAVDRESGAVYLTRLTGKAGIELVKYTGWKEPKELAKLPMAIDQYRDFPSQSQPWVMALDASARPPAVWLGGGGGSLLRVEDKGAGFESKKVGSGDGGKFGAMGFEALEIERYGPDRAVWFRYSGGNMSELPFGRYDESTGELAKLSLPHPWCVGTCVVPGPDGVLYAPTYRYGLSKYDRKGAKLAWQDPTTPPPDLLAEGDEGGASAQVFGQRIVKQYAEHKGPLYSLFLSVNMVFMTHTVGVRGDGHIFALDPREVGGRYPKMLREWLPSGKLVSEDPIVWKVSDGAVGPKFDAAGNIYIAEAIRPANELCPREFRDIVGDGKPGAPDPAGVRHCLLGMYGSIVKFGPKGGMIDVPGRNPYKGAPKLDPSLKTADFAFYHNGGGQLRGVKVTGAEWVRMGISQTAYYHLDGCNCENTRFDVDEFGRVWYPDLGRFRVCVLDTNGNDITHFGRYGTAEGHTAGAVSGAESKGPAPEIGFCYLIGVGATDKYVYAADSYNRRLLRLKQVYAAEESCEVK